MGTDRPPLSCVHATPPAPACRPLGTPEAGLQAPEAELDACFQGSFHVPALPSSGLRGQTGRAQSPARPPPHPLPGAATGRPLVPRQQPSVCRPLSHAAAAKLRTPSPARTRWPPAVRVWPPAAACFPSPRETGRCFRKVLSVVRLLETPSDQGDSAPGCRSEAAGTQAGEGGHSALPQAKTGSKRGDERTWGPLREWAASPHQPATRLRSARCQRTPWTRESRTQGAPFHTRACTRPSTVRRDTGRRARTHGADTDTCARTMGRLHTGPRRSTWCSSETPAEHAGNKDLNKNGNR